MTANHTSVSTAQRGDKRRRNHPAMSVLSTPPAPTMAKATPIAADEAPWWRAISTPSSSAANRVRLAAA